MQDALDQKHGIISVVWLPLRAMLPHLAHEGKMLRDVSRHDGSNDQLPYFLFAITYMSLGQTSP